MERSNTALLNGRNAAHVEADLDSQLETLVTQKEKAPVTENELQALPVEEETQLPEQPPRKRRPKALIFAALGVGAIVAGSFGYRWWNYASTHEETDNATVAGHIHQVSTRINGTVSEVEVSDNQVVKKGQLLVKLDPSDLQVKVLQAQAALDAAQRQANAAQTSIALAAQNAQAQTTQAQGNISDAQAGISAAQAQQGVSSAQAKLAQSRGGLQQATATGVQTEVNRSQYEAAKASIAQAQASLKDAQLQLSYTNIVAPSQGRVGRKTVEVGQRVQQGSPLLAIVEGDYWITANFKETQLEDIKPGQSVEIKLDAFPHHTFIGRVDSLSPASGSQFALLPPDNATGNFTKVVQRIPVKVTFDPQSIQGYEARITPGMSANVSVTHK